MYEKLKNLSIEELEVEIEDIDICIEKFYEEQTDIDNQIIDLKDKRGMLMDRIDGLRALSKLISDLILEKQKEERAQ